jgi:heme/copper-type cytochrome/quinol oxidase subunit 2
MTTLILWLWAPFVVGVVIALAAYLAWRDRRRHGRHHSAAE